MQCCREGVGGVGKLILNHKKEMKDVGSVKRWTFWRIVGLEVFEGSREQLVGDVRLTNGIVHERARTQGRRFSLT